MTLPCYANNATIARHLGVERNSVGNWRARYPPDGDLLPTPAPDAWERTLRGLVPLWLETRLPEWDDWHAAHQKLLATWRKAARPTMREVNQP